MPQMPQMNKRLNGKQFAPVRDVVDALDVQSGFMNNRRTGVTLIPSDWLAVDDH